MNKAGDLSFKLQDAGAESKLMKQSSGLTKLKDGGRVPW